MTGYIIKKTDKKVLLSFKARHNRKFAKKPNRSAQKPMIMRDRTTVEDICKEGHNYVGAKYTI